MNLLLSPSKNSADLNQNQSNFNEAIHDKVNSFKNKIIKSFNQEAYQKLKAEQIQQQQQQQHSQYDSDSQNDLIESKQNKDKSPSSSAHSITFEESSQILKKNKMSSYSFLNLLPEANPIRDKSQKEDQIKFNSVQSIFQLKQDEEFLVLGQQSCREPLNSDYENKLQQSKLQQNVNEQLNNMSKSSSQSSNLCEKNEQEESLDSQKVNQEEKEWVEKQAKQIKQKQKVKEKKQNEQVSFENTKNQTACQFYQQNEEFQRTRLIYKKQNQHMLVNLQNRIQVIKDTQSKRHMTFQEHSNTRNENLVFDSQFESGNLASAYMLSEQKYNLLVQQDLNTNGYTQWFYFKVTNKIKCSKVQFTIGNFYKKDSLFQNGMKISVFSKKKLESLGIGWHKSGFNIKYSSSTIQKGISQFTTNQNGKFSYLLQFAYDFEYDDDETYFAYSIPYTYSQLQKYLNSILFQNYNFFSMRSLCSTLLGNQLFLITITNPITQQNKDLQKKAIFITSRVHPGETVSNYVLEGFINFLTGQNYVFLKSSLNKNYFLQKFVHFYYKKFFDKQEIKNYLLKQIFKNYSKNMI